MSSLEATEPITTTIRIPITIRIAQANDLSKLEWHGEFLHFRNLFKRSYDGQLQGKRMLLVAVCKDYPVGRIFIQFIGTNLQMADGHSRGYIYSFRVMEIFQNQGIGSMLLRRAEKILTERDYRYATIAVAKDNATAMDMYANRGYEMFAEDSNRWHYFDHNGKIQQVDEPCWLLKKDLGSSKV